MNNKKHLMDLICKEYCKFYKESKDEELSCEGFKFFERLFPSLPNKKGTGYLSLHHRTIETPSENNGKVACPLFSYDSILMDILCKKCDFLIGGCDYRDEKYHGNASPCGGFILLHRIMEEAKT